MDGIVLEKILADLRLVQKDAAGFAIEKLDNEFLLRIVFVDANGSFDMVQSEFVEGSRTDHWFDKTYERIQFLPIREGYYGS